jgi:hypothetical protein
MRVRKVRCPSCGAPKLTSTKSAYVYCDFCAQFMDWDLQAAKYSAGVAAGPHYRALVQEMEPRLAAARKRRDRDALAACHHALFDQYMTDCPNGYSPRVGDPVYRAATLERSVHAQVVRELEPPCVAADAEVEASIRGLEWRSDHGVARPSAKSFWRMYEAVVAADLAVKAALKAIPQLVPDPDETPPELSAKIRDSAMVQAWIETLDHKTGEQLLDRTRLRDEYDEVDEPTLHSAACGHCGATRQAPAGARRGLCESCGHVTALGRTAFCGYCGAQIHFPLGAALTACGHCKAEARLMVE